MTDVFAGIKQAIQEEPLDSVLSLRVMEVLSDIMGWRHRVNSMAQMPVHTFFKENWAELPSEFEDRASAVSDVTRMLIKMVIADLHAITTLENADQVFAHLIIRTSEHERTFSGEGKTVARALLSALFDYLERTQKNLPVQVS